MGRKYRTETNLRSNLYVVGIADSGSGKNHAREIVNELFFEAGLAAHLGGNKIASGAGLLTALHRQPALLLQIDEFGMFLSAAADRKRSPRHITEILDNMTELYTAAGSVFLGAEYANHDGRNERRDIVQPCLCVYGTTTPLHFWNALQSSNVVDGSLARFIILPTEDDYPEEAIGRGIRTAPKRLLEQLRLVAAGGGHVPTGNLAGLGAGTSTAVDPMTVPMTPEAGEVFAELGADITRELREARGTGHTAVLARVSENAQKLALVAAVSRDPVAPEITPRRRRVGDRLRPALRQEHDPRGRSACRRQRDRAEPQEGARHHPPRGPGRADEDRADPQDAVPGPPDPRRAARDAGRGRASDHPAPALGDQAHGRAGRNRWRCGMSSFTAGAWLQRMRLPQAYELLGEIRISQRLNLSRGRVHTTHAHTARHTLSNIMNYMKYIYYTIETKGLGGPARLPGHLEPAEGFRRRADIVPRPPEFT